MHPVQALGEATASVPASGQAGKRGTLPGSGTQLYTAAHHLEPRPSFATASKLLQLLLQVK